MNNLKKVLALGLALVMLLGMFTVASAAEAKVATDLTDWDSINHQNAVALNVDLGIIKGLPDGSFAPTQNIDRASWAKLAYVAACGDEDADAYLGTVSGLKDVQGNWAESYISFLAANKYISGDTAGNYNPSNNVTVVEACKTMLTIMGYNAKDRGYENDAAWSGKIMSDAKANGLMKNVDAAQTAMQPLTRENAAQIIYNALQARTVEENKTYDQGNQYVQSYNRDVTLGYKVFGLVKLTGVATNCDETGKITFARGLDAVPANPNGVSVKNTGYVNNIVLGSLTDVGQVVDVFVKADAVYDAVNGYYTSVSVTELVSTNVAPSDAEPLKVITDETLFKSDSTRVWDKTTDEYVGVELDKDGNGNTLAPDFYVDGTVISGAQDLKKGEVAKLWDTNEDGRCDTVTILQYKVDEVTGEVRTKTEKNVEKAIIPGVTGGKFVPVSQINGDWKSLTKGDVVLYYTNGQTDGDKMVVGVEKAESITGKVTEVGDKGELTVNGTEYAATGIELAHTESRRTAWSDYDNEYTFYLDKNGGICYDVQNTDEAVAGNVAVVLKSVWIENGAIDANEYLEAKLLFVDGTTEVVRVNKIGTGNIVRNSDGTTSGSITMKTIVADDADNFKRDKQVHVSESVCGMTLNDLTPSDGFFSYRVDANGYYELTNLSQRGNDWGSPKAVNKTNADGIVKKPTFDGVNSANSRTVFVVEKDNGETITYGAYTGHANVPAVTQASIVDGVVIHEIDDNNGKEMGAAKYVYIKASAFADDVPEGFIFLRSASYRENADGNYSMSVVNNKGEEVRMLFSNDAMSLMTGVNAVENRLFAIDTINEGVVETVSQVAEEMDTAGSVHSGALLGIGNGVVTTDCGSFEYDSKTVIVLIDLKENTDTNVAGKYAYDSTSVLTYDQADNVDTDANVYDVVNVSLVEEDDLCNYIYIVRGVVLEQNA